MAQPSAGKAPLSMGATRLSGNHAARSGETSGGWMIAIPVVLARDVGPPASSQMTFFYRTAFRHLQRSWQ
jgi:hypothetical protein